MIHTPTSSRLLIDISLCDTTVDVDEAEHYLLSDEECHSEDLNDETTSKTERKLSPHHEDLARSWWEEGVESIADQETHLERARRTPRGLLNGIMIDLKSSDDVNEPPYHDQHPIGSEHDQELYQESDKVVHRIKSCRIAIISFLSSFTLYAGVSLLE